MNHIGFNFDTTYIHLSNTLFTFNHPEQVRNPSLIIVNHDLSKDLGLDLSSLDDQACAALFAGTHPPEGVVFFSQAYSGHQFGYYSVLGDGRAHLWGEHLDPGGKRYDIQFKGSGRTPYTRGGDGKAALSPMLREYLISEAMHYLGVATTRSLAVVSTSTTVIRDELLDGAILTRVASSHIRVGTFEYAKEQGISVLSELLDYTVARHFPELSQSDNKALKLFERVMHQHIDLVVDWMRVGFIHGVMNTDNMAICGETIDYGPCAFMDAYHLKTVFSSIDTEGRYAYGHQPKIVKWNLAVFASSLLPLVDPDRVKAVQLVTNILDQFEGAYDKKWVGMMRKKLGLSGEQQGDKGLILDLLTWMQKNGVDYTHTFLGLSEGRKPSGVIYQDEGFSEWYTHWTTRLALNKISEKESLNLMRSVNPAIIPRNAKVEFALSAAIEGDFAPFNHLLALLKDPYNNRSELGPYQDPPPDNYGYQTFCGT